MANTRRIIKNNCRTQMEYVNKYSDSRVRFEWRSKIYEYIARYNRCRGVCSGCKYLLRTIEFDQKKFRFSKNSEKIPTVIDKTNRRGTARNALR